LNGHGGIWAATEGLPRKAAVPGSQKPHGNFVYKEENELVYFNAGTLRSQPDMKCMKIATMALVAKREGTWAGESGVQRPAEVAAA
jgi:hypothetical protein